MITEREFNQILKRPLRWHLSDGQKNLRRVCTAISALKQAPIKSDWIKKTIHDLIEYREYLCRLWGISRETARLIQRNV